MRAVGYVRISKADAETTSPQRQRKAIRKLCADRGWDLARIYEDIDVSAYNGKRRRDFERMMGRLDEVGAVVFWRLDRLSRSVVETSQIMERCKDAGVELVSTDHKIDTTSALGKAFVQIGSVFAELESGQLSERAKQMHAHLKEKGVHVGRVPFGWRKVGGRLEPDPREQATLAEAARRYVTGESLRSVSADVGIQHPTLARMLRSERVLDALPPGLAGELAAAMAERGRSGTRAKRSLMGGTARCGVCGGGMTVVGRRERDGSRTPWSAYGCRVRDGRQHVYVSRPWLDAWIKEQVIEATYRAPVVIDVPGRKWRRAAATSSQVEARLELLEVDFYERGFLPRHRYLRRREALLRKLEKARDDEQEADLPPPELPDDLEDVWETLPLHERRRVIQWYWSSVEVGRAASHGRIDPGRVRLHDRA
jgi:DNA invertase Pin-like site-specific DNA recombinase